MAATVYDVTTFTVPDRDVALHRHRQGHQRDHGRRSTRSQTTQTTRPGAVIYIPPGHYTLQTTAVIDASFITVKGSGHGFMSLAVRDDHGSPGSWVEVRAGSSHIEIANTNQTGFRVTRSGTPAANGRLNGVVFQDFCIDGISASKPYLPGNGKVGIAVEYDSDALRIEGMGFVYLKDALVIRNADAFNITNNFITECGSAITMSDGSIVGKITNNYLISAWAGNSIFIENNQDCVISGNSFLWGARLQFKNVHRAVITGNKFVSSFSGMIVHETACHEQLISGNHFRRIFGDGGPARNDDLYGMVHLNGNDNSVTANTFSFDVPVGQHRAVGCHSNSRAGEGRGSQLPGHEQARLQRGRPARAGPQHDRHEGAVVGHRCAAAGPDGREHVASWQHPDLVCTSAAWPSQPGGRTARSPSLGGSAPRLPTVIGRHVRSNPADGGQLLRPEWRSRDQIAGDSAADELLDQGAHERVAGSDRVDHVGRRRGELDERPLGGQHAPVGAAGDHDERGATVEHALTDVAL